MLHTILFGLIGAAIFSRIVFRRRLMRYAYGGCGAGHFGGGWGGPRGPRHWHHMHRHFRGAFHPGHGPGQGPGLGRGGFGQGWGWDDGGGQPAPSDPRGVGQDLGRALGELDLSERQRTEVDESLTRLRESVGGELDSWPGLPAVLALVAASDFDRARVEAAASHVSGALRQEIVDGLEHFHNVLTTEQREKLARIARW